MCICVYVFVVVVCCSLFWFILQLSSSCCHWNPLAVDANLCLFHYVFIICCHVVLSTEACILCTYDYIYIYICTCIYHAVLEFAT